MALETRNPATGELVATFDALTDDQLESKLAAAVAAVDRLADAGLKQRCAWLRRAAEILDDEVDTIAPLLVLEMGKTLKAAKAEVTKCAAGFRFYADNAAEMLADEPADAEAVGAVRAWVRHDPLGVVLAVMPWNFPLWQVVRFAAPALALGNAGLLKHASNVPQTALLLEDVLSRAGFPEGAFTTLLVDVHTVEQLLRDPRVAAATVTGSTGAGRAVGKTAGEELKKVVLELGGSDAFVVLPSTDLERAVQAATTGRVQNNGQSCIAAKRFLVHTDVYDDFEALFAKSLAALVVGDPMNEGTDVGPLATEQGRRDVAELVDDAVAKGARVVVGGQVPDGPGWYYPPTLLADLTPEMRVWTEEVFGPVALLIRVADLDEAVEVANATEFGLGSSIWTEDEAERESFIRRSQAGAVFVNGFTTSYPSLPFGGVKGSGHGRELARVGLLEFANSKTVWVGA